VGEDLYGDLGLHDEVVWVIDVEGKGAGVGPVVNRSASGGCQAKPKKSFSVSLDRLRTAFYRSERRWPCWSLSTSGLIMSTGVWAKIRPRPVLGLWRSSKGGEEDWTLAAGSIGSSANGVVWRKAEALRGEVTMWMPRPEANSLDVKRHIAFSRSG
jgi:hypothetical protein